MEWLNSLFFGHTPLQAVVILSIIIAVGLGLGKIHLFGISLGVTFVFFAGILAGHLGFSIDPNMLNYAESFGLVLFVYELGLQVGPGFFSSFRKGGVQLNMLGIGVILAGTVMTVLFSKLGGIPMSDMVGILCGATTNTPALGAAQQTLKQMGEPASGAALSCAVTYPLGVVGVILAMLLVRKLFVRPSDIDIHEHEDTNQTFIATFKVHNPAIFNKSIKEVALLSYPKFVISRLWREGTVSIPTSEKILKENDRLLVITTEKDAPSLTILFGEQENQDWNKEDIDWNAIDSQLISNHIIHKVYQRHPRNDEQCTRQQRMIGSFREPDKRRHIGQTGRNQCGNGNTHIVIDAELHATGTDAEAGKSADRGKQKRHPVTTEQFTETSAGKAGTDGNNVWHIVPLRVFDSFQSS